MPASRKKVVTPPLNQISSSTKSGTKLTSSIPSLGSIPPSSSLSAASTITTTTTHPPLQTIYFWRPHETPYGIFSQWYESSITAPLLNLHPGQHLSSTTTYVFNTAEQFMMAHKAHLFSPTDTSFLHEILSTPDPSAQRRLGRTIPNFSEEVWHNHRYNIVVQGSYLKFTQNDELKRLLLETGDREIVEASPKDRIWGVGFGEKNAGKRREDWGLNLLGKALMEVRERIKKEEKEKEK